jgi:energy-coupling factor transporter ATP-binding protein EcfA2
MLSGAYNGAMSLPDDNCITYFARTYYRHIRDLFGIKRRDRLFHTYVIGKTGAGKSTLLHTLILQDIRNGEGLTVIDPHGDLVEAIAAAIPERRRNDLIYFNVPDPGQPYGYNPLKHVAPDRRSLAASGVLEAFHKLWGEKAWGQRLEYILRNALLAMLDQPNADLTDLLRLLRDDTYRKEVVENIQNERVKEFWVHEYPKYASRYRAEAIAPIQSKIGAFLADPVLRRILTAPEQPLHLRKIMDDGKILLINLAKGKLGEDSASMLGALLVTTLGLAGFSRADLDPAARRHHWVYMDEFQSFTTLSIANMLSELRKYNVGITMAHQYLTQLEPDVRDAVIGNAGTLISFRLGGQDAPIIAREFLPTFSTEDLVNLPNYHIYLKLMIDGAPSKPFSAITVPPDEVIEIE